MADVQLRCAKRAKTTHAQLALAERIQLRLECGNFLLQRLDVRVVQQQRALLELVDPKVASTVTIANDLGANSSRKNKHRIAPC